MISDDNFGKVIQDSWRDDERATAIFLVVFILCVVILSWLTLAVALGAAWAGTSFAFSQSTFLGLVCFSIWGALITGGLAIAGYATYTLVEAGQFLFQAMIDKFKYGQLD